MSVPPKKIPKAATPRPRAQDKQRNLHPRVLLSKISEFPSPVKSDMKEHNLKPMKLNFQPKSSGPKSKFLGLVASCIFKLKDRKGSSRAAILNQLKLDYTLEIGCNETSINTNLKVALKKGLADGVLKMAKEVGKGSGSFKLTDEELRRQKAKFMKVNNLSKVNVNKNINQAIEVENDNTIDLEPQYVDKEFVFIKFEVCVD